MKKFIPLFFMPRRYILGRTESTEVCIWLFPTIVLKFHQIYRNEGFSSKLTLRRKLDIRKEKLNFYVTSKRRATCHLLLLALIVLLVPDFREMAIADEPSH
jgi:hypothetical protein